MKEDVREQLLKKLFYKSFSLDNSYPGVLSGPAGAAARICGTGRALTQHSASERAALPGTGVGRRGGNQWDRVQTQLTLASRALLKASAGQRDSSPCCQRPFGCQTPFRGWKEFHVLFHGVQTLGGKKRKSMALGPQAAR